MKRFGNSHADEIVKLPSNESIAGCTMNQIHRIKISHICLKISWIIVRNSINNEANQFNRTGSQRFQRALELLLFRRPSSSSSSSSLLHFSTDIRDWNFFSSRLNTISAAVVFIGRQRERMYNFVCFGTRRHTLTHSHKNTIQNLFDPKKVKNFYKYSRWWFMIFGSTMVQCSQSAIHTQYNGRSRASAHASGGRGRARKKWRNTTEMI